MMRLDFDVVDAVRPVTLTGHTQKETQPTDLTRAFESSSKYLDVMEVAAIRGGVSSAQPQAGFG